MKYKNTSFPIQKLTLSKKNKEWREASVDYVVSMYESDILRFTDMETLYNLYNSVFSEEDLKYVTNPYGVDLGFPAMPQNFNIIRPEIDTLIGEESKRPVNIRVSRTSQDAAGELQQKAKEMLDQYMMSAILSKMSPENAAEFQRQLQAGEVQPPEQIYKYLTRDYKDVVETTAYHALNYLRNKLNIDNEFLKGWKDALISAIEIYYVGILNGEPHLERVNPMYFSYDKSPDLEYIEDGDWACRKMRMSYTEVYDRFYDKMKEADLDKLLIIVGQEGPGIQPGKNMIDDYWQFRKMDRDGTFNLSAENVVDVWHATWKSFKKVGFVTFEDEAGNVQQTMVDESYAVIGTEIDITWDWIIEVWEGYRIGSDLYVGIQPLEYQHVSIDNPNSQKLPYTGAIYSNTNSKAKSLVSIMKPLQYMYIVLWYRLELALARDKGKVLTMDITQIPKSMGVDPNKWLHYLSSVGVNFINPYEEGWDIPGREGGKPAQFNQITNTDLTMSNVVVQYVQLLEKIEQNIENLTGISRQRKGSITSSELVGNVQSAIIQSNNITEPLFWMHSQAKRRALTMLLDTAKEAWRLSGKKKLHYIFDDATRAFMDISEPFLNQDVDVFITDSSKEVQQIETIRNVIQAAVQNGASMLDAAEAISTDNMSMLKDKLKDIEDKRMQQQQEAMQQQQQAEMQKIQLQQQVQQQANMLKQQELDLKKYEIDTNNETKLAIAEMNSFGFAAGSGVDTTDDINAVADRALKEREIAAKQMDTEMSRQQKDNEIYHKRAVEEKKIQVQKEIENNKSELEKKRIALEEKKLNSAKELQTLKDKAAMEREQLKARTALKNKTVSGK